MRIHLRLFDLASGDLITEGTFESPSLTISSDTRMADFTHPRLRHTPTYEITSDGYHATIRNQSASERLRRKNTLQIDDDLVLKVDLYPRPDAVPPVRGACPSCGGPLSRSQVGGAYRSVAREEHRCGECGTAVLALRDASSALGQFVDQSASDWVTVTVAFRCPQCTQSMLRAVFRSAHGEAQVERCAGCQLVVVEPEDEARLRGER